MQKKDNKGIALITLVVAVLMMIIISSIIIYNTTSHIKVNNLNKMYNDIRLLREQVFLYYSKNNELPVLQEYNAGISDDILLNSDVDRFFIIDIDKIDKNIKSNLNYGKDYYDENYEGDDIYIINTETHQVFYVKGINVDNKLYYTIPNEDYENIEYDNIYANPPVLEENLEPIIVRFNEETEEDELISTNVYSKEWYNYNNAQDITKWAKAKSNTSSSTIYIWVPRYAYNAEEQELVFLKGTTNIPIEKGKDISGENWIIPDAFENREKQKKTGIWISAEGINSLSELRNAVYDLTGKNNIVGPENTTITEGTFTYYNPVIPVGFKTVQTDTASWRSTNGIQVDGWNEGLVIEDEVGNQFVWIPVDGVTVKYEKWCTSGSYTSEQCEEDSSAIPVLDQIDQINNFGGFYISRYEISESETNPISVANQQSWTNVTYNKANEDAKKLYDGTVNTNSHIKSGLVTGTMWDTLMKWGENEIINLPESYIIKNIYDLAGNKWEWTAEYPTQNDSIRITRGGSNSEVDSRNSNNATNSSNDIRI